MDVLIRAKNGECTVCISIFEFERDRLFMKKIKRLLTFYFHLFYQSFYNCTYPKLLLSISESLFQTNSLHYITISMIFVHYYLFIFDLTYFIKSIFSIYFYLCLSQPSRSNKQKDILTNHPLNALGSTLTILLKTPWPAGFGLGGAGQTHFDNFIQCNFISRV